MKSLPLFLSLFLAPLHLTLAEPALARHEVTVGGIAREALLWVPAKAKSEPAPLVFAFHGHGGSMANAARSFHIHTAWPEAIVIYPQGLPTRGQLTDPEGKRAGWQATAGAEDDRDLKFVDALLGSLEAKLKVDTRRIYSTGHSNGGGFTYLLWAERGDKFAAFAPSASAALRTLPKLKGKPLIHIGAENDPLVKFAWQERTIEAVRKNNQCGEGRPWGGIAGCTEYPSKTGAPVVTFLHSGGHAYSSDAPAHIVKFFKEHALP